MFLPSASDLCKGIQIVHRWKLYIYTVLFLRVLFDAKCAIRNHIVHYFGLEITCYQRQLLFKCLRDHISLRLGPMGLQQLLAVVHTRGHREFAIRRRVSEARDALDGEEV